MMIKPIRTSGGVVVVYKNGQYTFFIVYWFNRSTHNWNMGGHDFGFWGSPFCWCIRSNEMFYWEMVRTPFLVLNESPSFIFEVFGNPTIWVYDNLYYWSVQDLEFLLDSEYNDPDLYYLDWDYGELEYTYTFHYTYDYPPLDPWEKKQFPPSKIESES